MNSVAWQSKALEKQGELGASQHQGEHSNCELQSARLKSTGMNV